MPTISVRLSEEELKQLSAARRRTRRATYCQDAAVWFATRVLDYAQGAGEAEATQILVSLLARLRPTVNRWYRSLGAEFVLTFTDEELGPIDEARSTVARASFAYLAVRCRTCYDLAQAQSPPTLPQLAALVEPDRGVDEAEALPFAGLAPRATLHSLGVAR